MELYNGITDILIYTNLDFELLGRRVVLLLSFLNRARFIKQYY